MVDRQTDKQAGSRRVREGERKTTRGKVWENNALRALLKVMMVVVMMKVFFFLFV